MPGVDSASPLGCDGFAELLSPFCLPRVVAVGASGGGDSTALLVLAAEWAGSSGRSISAVTVDHGIREESRLEAERVASLCRALEVPHQTLEVGEAAPEAGIQEWARRQRFDLLSRWSQQHGGVPVMLAHTLEDQAETVLMRLLRGAGVDGLAAMRADSLHEGLRVVRPLLSVSSSRLRATLRTREIRWIEDPSNSDLRFERVRLRKAMRGLGIDAAALTRTAASMERARCALEAEAGRLLERSASRGALGETFVDLRHFAAAEEEHAVRALARAIRVTVGRGGLRIRRAGLDEAARWAVEEGSRTAGCTLAGCMLRRASKNRLLIVREPAMCDPPIRLVAGQQAVWDGRWRVWFEGNGTVDVGALGRSCTQGLLGEADSWRESPALARASVPAFRRDGRIVAVPSARIWSDLDASSAGAAIAPVKL